MKKEILSSSREKKKDPKKKKDLQRKVRKMAAKS